MAILGESCLSLRSNQTNSVLCVIAITFYFVVGPDDDIVIFEWERLSAFQRLLLVKAVRPSALVSAVRCFVEEQMGEEFVTSGTLNLEEMFHEADAKTPLIFILSPGKSHELKCNAFNNNSTDMHIPAQLC